MTRVDAAELPALISPNLGPQSLKERPWGGQRLARMRAEFVPAGTPSTTRWGESWEFSTLAGSESRALDRDLSELLGGPLPFLAKLIDTEQALSIQVHPEDDASAGTIGKEEAWIILDAAPGAAVLCGVAEGIDAAELRRRSEAAWADASAGEELIAALERIEVQRGDVILVPGRTIHAIQGGIMLAEIQQPTDCTYRLFDYGSERQIHPEQALGTIDVGAKALRWSVSKQGAHSSTLAGQHVHLEVLRGPEAAKRGHAGVPTLIVCVDGELEVQIDGGSHRLVAGDLRLWMHGSLSCKLAQGAQLVLGHIPN